MASDALAVLDTAGLEKAAPVGWSDGACIAMSLGLIAPARIASVFFLACNMDPSGTKGIKPSPILERRF